MTATTLFRYRCRCGTIDTLNVDGAAVRCGSCGAAYQRSTHGVIVFNSEGNEQNQYFDGLYRRGNFHKIDEIDQAQRNNYQEAAERAQHYLAVCGVDLEAGLTTANVLDIACGSGWITAGLMSHPKIQACHFHACDISPDGLAMLAAYQRNQSSSNILEMSVQDAEHMIFEDGTFDFVIGSSVLHHFNDVPAFLRQCRRILKEGGAATFGEPFAVGYGIGSACLSLAQERVGTSYQAIRDLYADMLARVAGPPEGRSKLVDKHLFVHTAFAAMAREAGFCDVEFRPFASRAFYRTSFIDELLAERAIHDATLARTAKEIYSTFFAIFDADTYGHTLSAFNQIVLRG